MTTPSPAAAFSGAAKKHALETCYRWMQAACVAVLLVAVAAFFHVGSFPSLAFAFAGAFVVHMAMQPSRRELVLVAACAAMFGAVYRLLHGDVIHFYGGAIGVPGAFLGLGSVLVAMSNWLWTPVTSRRIPLERAQTVVLIPAISLCSIVALNVAMGFTPITYDRLLYVFDLKFFAPASGGPSWAIGVFLRTHSWLFRLCGAVYNSLPMGLAAGLAIQWRDRRNNARDSVDLRRLIVSLGVVGFLLYQVCPVAGPLYLFSKDFPSHVPSLAGLAIQPAWLQAAARNGMPSLHVGWTLLLFWNTRTRAWWVAVIAAIYLTLTAIATLGFGEHYLADLMVSPALAAAIQGAWTRTSSPTAGKARWAAVALGSIITLAWLIAFRSGAAMLLPQGAATWSMAIVSVVLPAIAAWRLEQAANRQAAA